MYCRFFLEIKVSYVYPGIHRPKVFFPESMRYVRTARNNNKFCQIAQEYISFFRHGAAAETI